MAPNLFADTLTRYREVAGLTQKQLAARANVSPSSVNRWELGHSDPKRDNAETLDKVLSAGGKVLSAWQAHTNGTGLPDWARDLAAIEAAARHLMLITPAATPGMLQCPEVAAAVFRAGLPAASPEEIARLVSLRCERLAELPDLRVTAVFPAAAVSGLAPTLRAAQARALLSWAETDRVMLHLVPEGTTLLVPAAPLMVFRLRTGDLAVVSDHADGNVIHEADSHDRLSVEATAAIGAALPHQASLEELRKHTT